MRKLLLAAVIAVTLVANRDGFAADPPVVSPYEAPAASVPMTRLDALVQAAQRKRGVSPANACSDEVFVRRIHLDLIGTLPEPADVRRFLDDKRPGKRAALVETLFARPEFADWWALRWCDVLRVKSEFPINLWPDAAQAYHRWVREQIRANRPWDQFARDLLTSSGSNFRVPPVNFYRAVQGRDPASIASAVALTFMGERTDRWTPGRRADLAAFFAHVRTKATTEWKEEIVFDDPAPRPPRDAVFPDGTTTKLPPEADPRTVFANWLLERGNPWFARSVVNRLWAWFLGRGVVHEPDDLRADNPPTVADLLPLLEKEFTDAKFDVRHVIRLIVNSRTYQQSPIPRDEPAAAEAVFACYPVRRMDAEALVDALSWLGGTGEEYSSTTPEPWTFIPSDERTITLADGSVTSALLETFGRPARDTGLLSERNDEPSGGQRLHLLNSTDVQRKIQGSARLRAAFDGGKGDPAEIVRRTYLTVLARFPVESEITAAVAYCRTPGRTLREASLDLAWALVNTREFLYRH